MASERDEQARAFATRYARHGLLMLVPADLSRRGWRWRSTDPRSSVALIKAQRLLPDDIDGVITRLPWVLPCDLPDIQAGDREYVAAEISAFLLTWLASLRCPLLNRPSAQCLSGPGWHPQMWLGKAQELGIPTRAFHQHASLTGQPAVAEPEPRDAVTLTVVGAAVVGKADAVLQRNARRLAAAARVQLLCVRFDSRAPDALLLGASLWPDLSDPKIGEAVWSSFAAAAMPRRAVAR
jgi:hypothetical protein